MLIAGIDEVGRGCLAGPVVAACVVLPEGFADARIKDSKMLSKKRRDEAAKIIYENASSVAVGVVCSFIIDKINILNAAKQAMQLSLSRITCSYDKIICDAVFLNHAQTPFEHPNKADRDFIQVAAASIVAKTYRDALMEKLALIYPQYGWERNAGYGTAQHITAIRAHGACLLHRKSFIRKI